MDATKLFTAAAQFESLALRLFLYSSFKNSSPRMNTRIGNLPLFMAQLRAKLCGGSNLSRNVHDALFSGNDYGVSKKRKIGST